MNFILLIGLVYLYLKYRDISKELFNINNSIERIDNELDLLNSRGVDSESV